ncbi:hypothetical protein A0H81_14401 [Grifola frondosa]|uniref:Uncharacterized protein n=1 Tax=Grifola frondosa TaxID=5627 RepID=A0A1C7LLU4_GRIFR|nr:hypothetical protein A0H81_14401 [Grifola frondosa]
MKEPELFRGYDSKVFNQELNSCMTSNLSKSLKFGFNSSSSRRFYELEFGRCGIPADIIAQTDRTSVWSLTSAAEALNMFGIVDPCELY